jgi:hypothetical protein
VLRVWLDVGQGKIPAPATFSCPNDASAIGVGDFTQDGWPDIVVASPGSNAVLFFGGTGSGNFASPISIPTGTLAPVHLVVADFSGDGVPDIAVAKQTDGEIGLLEHASTGWRPIRMFAEWPRGVNFHAVQRRRTTRSAGCLGRSHEPGRTAQSPDSHHRRSASTPACPATV